MAQSSSGFLSPIMIPAVVGLTATVVGVAVFFAARPALAALIVMGLAAYASLRVGRWLLSRDPVSARLIMELWVVGGLAAGALATTVILWWLVDAELTWLIPSGALGEKGRDVVRGVVTGAVATFLTTVVTKEIGEGSGPFSVKAQFKAAVATLAKALTTPLTQRLNDALNHEAVEGEAVQGWGFSGRGMRARVIADELRALGLIA